MNLVCEREERRDLVRLQIGWNGLDYVELGPDQRTLTLYFLGKLPPELSTNQPGLERFLSLTGGQRVTDIKIVDVDPMVDPDPKKDDYLVVRLDKSGDFSTYTLRLVSVERIDPRYDRVTFSFKVDCPSDLDCAPPCSCGEPVLVEPELDYLAKDYASFRRLILDRLALIVPEWTERHVPDLGIALVELLAYAGDYLSYYQDAVATEAYLDTARERISVRRHTRLVDYHLSEGCNARAWVCLEVSSELTLSAGETAFITGLNETSSGHQDCLVWDDLEGVPVAAYEVFEPLVADREVPIMLVPAHNEIAFYTWGNQECCLKKGSTRATLLDYGVIADPIAAPAGESVEVSVSSRPRGLRLKAGDVLIFEEVLGPVTGLQADADPTRRHAVRLTSVVAGEDPAGARTGGSPTPYLEIIWAHEDALPFDLCLSAVGAAPECRFINNISVARGNVILVDHGRTQDSEDLNTVPTLQTDSCCECAGEPGDVQVVAGRFEPVLGKAPLTFSQPLPKEPFTLGTWHSAAALTNQHMRLVQPNVWLTSQPGKPWASRYDLVDSLPDDWHFVVEIDDGGVAHLRFGDGEMGARPVAGMRFSARYRVGNGTAGNVGAESISRLIQRNTRVTGVSVSVRNPVPAKGGTDPEQVAAAKLLAPYMVRKELQRAITAEDYAALAKRSARIQKASATLAWTGSWYEADVAADPYGREDTPDRLARRLRHDLERYRRIGHDLAVRSALYVPLRLKLEVCALPHYQPAHVKAALLARFSNRRLTGGRRGFFHPDELTFGDGLYLSRIIAAAQAIPGVECVTVTEFHRFFESPNHELKNGLLPLGSWEIAQLDNDPNFPEHGSLEIVIRGGA